MATKSKEISLKLMVNTKSNKLVFAEASNDFVDLLFFLLSLPIATVIKLLNTESLSLGSFGNLYTSLANLNETHLLPNIQKDMHLNPLILTSATNIPIFISPSTSIMSFKFYKCTNPRCKGVSPASNCYCISCGQNTIGSAIHDVSIVNGCDAVSEVTTTSRNDLKGFVKEGIPYMIYDDLTVKPMSTTLIISVMNKAGVVNTQLKEMDFKVGGKEMVKILKASFQSTSVLTDVFLLGLVVKKSCAANSYSSYFLRRN